uniref:Uncharacterized protein n=1 Tax=Mustela putorius furo TaxID=9669 RepID=M3XUQ7_MUSPF
MNVRNVEEASTISHISQYTREFTQERNPVNVSRVRKPPRNQLSQYLQGYTQGKKIYKYSSERNLSPVIHTSKYHRKFTKDVTPMNVKNGKFFFLIFLFIYLTDRSQVGREAAEREEEAGPLPSREPDAGLDPGP